jgi:hypothetical protein
MFVTVLSVPINLEHRDAAAYPSCSDTVSRSDNVMLNVGMMFKRSIGKIMV